jgi:hypothetical protein
MIYKFEDPATVLEVELFNEKSVSFAVMSEDMSIKAYLNKKDVYYLIGALHLLHKEMK